MRALIEVHVVGLLGQFEHKIEFSENSQFIVLHGPNGVGKTKLLELVNATFKLDLPHINESPFESLVITFSDSTVLSLSKNVNSDSPFPTDGSSESLSDFGFTFQLTASDRTQRAWTFDIRDPEIFASVYRPGAGLPLPRELRRRLVEPGGSTALREAQRALARLRPGDSENLGLEMAPAWLSEFLLSTKVHLIETQRLLVFGPETANRDGERRGRRNTVDEFAVDLSLQISQVLARNSRTSQQLDGTFPRRVLSEPPPGPEVTDERIRDRYAEQTQLREALNEIAVLDDQEDLPLPGGKLEPWQRRVLWIYLEDTERKLSTFRYLLDRITLLREIVNSRFLNKELVIDRERGFRFKTPMGHDLDPTQLSSGEQHELVLVYDLLFKVEEQSIVLIDEPEISLHIAWQQKFLEDVQRIAEISNLRFIIATHSPQVVHKWWSHAVALGPGISGEESSAQ